MFQLYRFSDDDAVWWRLVSPNGRGFARSTAALPTSAVARESVDAVRASVGALVPVLRLTTTHRWQWFLTADDAPVVQGIGDQDRRVRCAHACRNFVLLAPDAQVDPTVTTYRRTSAPVVARRSGT
ncbi:hypothetical protein [uncultured Cellulomonas sp.]|uniref:hypothetical protein n=1 Tax=uncultured Cellulomonas sp. TaxID=189682 RepID=UPI0028EC4102|nr:hypothetical protein [uncultured Cellulomonas sp.]